MLDGLLKSKFYSKCKSAIKMMKIRMEIIKRKRSAMQKYLKNDVVDLLKSGLDTNAYGRVEGLWNELNLSSCYDFTEQFCTQISNHLASMDKQRECPEECKEAAASLMFAAARFSDLPELRDLRTLFSQRYGNSIEIYVSKEFVHKLKSTRPTKEMKLQLMQEIALEAVIEWNSKTLEQKLYKSSPSAAPDGTEIENKREDSMSISAKIATEGTEHKREDSMKFASSEREIGQDVADGTNLNHPSDGEENIQVDCINRKVLKNEPHAVSALQEETDDKKPFCYKSIPPPYTKSKVSIPNAAPDVPPTGSEIKELENIQKCGVTGESDDLQRDDRISNTKPKPKSVRRTNPKTVPGKEKEETPGTASSETMSSKGTNQRRHKQRDERDEEEREMDRLLSYYSTKKLSQDIGKSEPDFKPSKGAANDTGRSRDDPPTRVASLPADSSPTEARKVHARASSLQPEVLNGHVCPKLPDYDDFIARLAALRENIK